MNEVFKYKTVMTFINHKSELTEIPMNNLSFFVIDKDYENTNMPVITMSVNLDRKLKDEMIQNMDESMISFQVYKYNEVETDDVGTCILNHLFIYIIDGDVSYSQDIEYTENTNEEQVLNPTTIYLLKKDLVNNNRQLINCVNRAKWVGDKKIPITMTDLIMRITNYVKPLLLEPLENNKSFDEIVIPPISSISDYLEYLNDNISTFYSTGYRYFLDYDTAYIMSKSGKYVDHKNQRFSSIIFDISELNSLESADQGSSYYENNRLYHIPVNVTFTKFRKNIITKHIATNVACIGSSGEVISKSLNNASKLNTEKYKIINHNTSNSGICDAISNDLINSELIVDIVKNDLDASLFTINKEYHINHTIEHEDYNGRYLICSAKQIFVKQDSQFIMNTALRFKKISP